MLSIQKFVFGKKNDTGTPPLTRFLGQEKTVLKETRAIGEVF